MVCYEMLWGLPLKTRSKHLLLFGKNKGFEAVLIVGGILCDIFGAIFLHIFPLSMQHIPQ